MANIPITRYVSKFTGPAIDAAIEKMSGIGNITGADINKAVTIINSGINNNNKILFGDAETTTKWIDIGTGLEIQNNTLVVTGGGSSTNTWRPVRVNGTQVLDSNPVAANFLNIKNGSGIGVAFTDSNVVIKQLPHKGLSLSTTNSVPIVNGSEIAEWLDNELPFSVNIDNVVTFSVEMYFSSWESPITTYEGKTDSKIYRFQVNNADFEHRSFSAVSISDISSGASKATATTLGTIKLGSNTVQQESAQSVTSTLGKTYAIQLNSSDQAVVNVPWVNTWRPISVDGTQEIGSGTDTGNLKLVSGNGISITVDNNDNITIANTGSTAYSAGTGISISSNEISIANLPAAQSLSSSSATTVTDQTLIERITAGLPFVADIDNSYQTDDYNVVMYKTGNEEVTKPVYKGQRNGVTYSTTITFTSSSAISFSQVTASSGGQTYSAGAGIDITSNTISVEDMPVFTWTSSSSSDISISDQSVLDHIAKGLPIKVQLDGSSSPYMILYNTYTEYKSKVTVYTYTSRHIEMDNDLSIARFEDEYSTTVRISDSGIKKISKPTLVTGYLDLTSISSIDIPTVIGTTGELAIVDGLVFDAEACSAIIDNAETYHLPIKCLYTYTGTVVNNQTSYPMLQYQGKYYHNYSGTGAGNQYGYIFSCRIDDKVFELTIKRKYVYDGTIHYDYYLEYTVDIDVLDMSSILTLPNATSSLPVIQIDSATESDALKKAFIYNLNHKKSTILCDIDNTANRLVKVQYLGQTDETSSMTDYYFGGTMGYLPNANPSSGIYQRYTMICVRYYHPAVSGYDYEIYYWTYDMPT